MVKKSFIGATIIAAAVALSVVSTPVVAAASAPKIVATTSHWSGKSYECRTYNWFIGWRVVYTNDWRYYTDRGWTCYCIV